MAQRLLKEHRELQRDYQKGSTDIYLEPVDGNLFHWNGSLKGPEGTPYEHGRFRIDVVVPTSYPLAAPGFRFVTQIFHPNVHPKTGEICVDILKNAWSPAWTLQSTCRAILVLMAHPEPDSPLNCDAGNLLRQGDNRGFRSVAKMYTSLYAQQISSSSSSSAQQQPQQRPQHHGSSSLF